MFKNITGSPLFPPCSTSFKEERALCCCCSKALIFWSRRPLSRRRRRISSNTSSSSALDEDENQSNMTNRSSQTGSGLVYLRLLLRLRRLGRGRKGPGLRGPSRRSRGRGQTLNGGDDENTWSKMQKNVLKCKIW